MGRVFRMGRILLLLISTTLAAPQGNNSDSSGYLDYSGIIYERSAISNSLVEDRAINTCGCAPVSSTDRIVGGKEVNPKGKLPYQVMFFPCAPSGQCGLCGGTIVNKKFVITAAHCWDSRMTNLRVIVGEHNVFCDGVNEGGKVINVKKATMHPDYNKKTTDNDIAVLGGDCVGDTVAGVKHDTGGTAGGVQGEHSLDGDIHGRGVEGLEHDLGHLLPVGLGVEGGFGKKDWVLLGGNSQLIVEGVMPDLLHVIPVGHDTVLNGVLQGEDTPLGLGLVTDVGVLLSHANHDTLVAGTSNDGGEDGPGGVV